MRYGQSGVHRELLLPVFFILQHKTAFFDFLDLLHQLRIMKIPKYTTYSGISMI